MDLLLASMGAIQCIAEVKQSGTTLLADPLPDGGTVNKRVPVYLATAIRVVSTIALPPYRSRTRQRPPILDPTTTAGAAILLIGGRQLMVDSSQVEEMRVALPTPTDLATVTASVALSWVRSRRTG